jgi:hypothetical protein
VGITLESIYVATPQKTSMLDTRREIVYNNASISQGNYGKVIEELY